MTLRPARIAGDDGLAGQWAAAAPGFGRPPAGCPQAVPWLRACWPSHDGGQDDGILTTHRPEHQRAQSWPLSRRILAMM